MRAKVIQSIKDRFTSFTDLALVIDADQLAENITIPKNKSLGDHVWCIVGARESYTHALEAGQWSGFTCSLQSITPSEVINKFNQSAEQFSTTIDTITDWTSAREDFLIKLLEHETIHEGQIIRHMYALNYDLPTTWKWA